MSCVFSWFDDVWLAVGACGAVWAREGGDLTGSDGNLVCEGLVSLLAFSRCFRLLPVRVTFLPVPAASRGVGPVVAGRASSPWDIFSFSNPVPSSLLDLLLLRPKGQNPMASSMGL